MPDSRQLPKVDEVRKLLLTKSLHDFVRRGWHVVEPARPFKDNWHIGAICEHLQAVSAGQIKRLVINVPPGTMKSLTCSVFWPAWRWTHAPETKWIFASYGDPPAKRDSLRTRRLVESAWYRGLWGDVWRPQQADWGVVKFSTDRAGYRFYTTVAGAVTGEHADVQVVDDPLKPRELTGASSTRRGALERALTWWTETMSTRVTDAERSARVIIMQRLHESDLAGAMLLTGEYNHLCLPMHGTRLGCPVRVPHPCSLERG